MTDDMQIYAELYGFHFSDYDKSIGKELIETIRKALTAHTGGE